MVKIIKDGKEIMIRLKDDGVSWVGYYGDGTEARFKGVNTTLVRLWWESGLLIEVGNITLYPTHDCIFSTCYTQYYPLGKKSHTARSVVEMIRKELSNEN